MKTSKINIDRLTQLRDKAKANMGKALTILSKQDVYSPAGYMENYAEALFAYRLWDEITRELYNGDRGINEVLESYLEGLDRKLKYFTPCTSTSMWDNAYSLTELRHMRNYWTMLNDLIRNDE